MSSRIKIATCHSLWDCVNAKVKGKKIKCQYRTLPDVRISRAAKGEPMVCEACSGCADFTPFDDILLPQDRGWEKRG